ncbi:SPOR domain-containing protein [Qipengyuania sp. 1NDH17]|uniref:SPOR domain-containing protein n=1 Tax=Qipengyuania polymorpha TaxID=2867234 RepID=A0ABS7IXA0_9SPHN|nr:SPOR domain-containing protein [Qipengyuania polymorpha]MBX7457993.1 SPOR domain-containing protein [Qipengyuania polymorpha]
MARPPYEHDEDWDTAELELMESDERLPWLDAEDDEEREAGFATSRLVMLGVLSLVVVGALVAVAWFAMGATSDEPPADGSLVEAPEGPYKTKPEDPGGKVHAGTGDTSFAVGEGQTRVGKLADKTPTPTPTPEPSDEPAGPSLATTLNEGPRASEPPKGTLVQVGAYPSRGDAQEAWGRLMRQTTSLNGVRHRVVEAQVDIGTVYRLQAVTGGNAEARALCGRLKDDGLACFVK